MSRDGANLEIPVESQFKKKRTGSVKPDKIGLHTSIEHERHAKYSVDHKKRSLNTTANAASLKGIFKSTMKEKKMVTEGNQDVDQKVREMMAYYKSREFNEAIVAGRGILSDNPDNIEALYIVGLCASMLEKHELTIKYFETLILLEPKYKKNVYLFLSIAYKKSNKMDLSFNVLNKAIKLFDNFYEAYVESSDADLPGKGQLEAVETDGGPEGLP